MGWKSKMKSAAKAAAVGTAAVGVGTLVVAGAMAEAESESERRHVRDSLNVGRTRQLANLEHELGEARMSYANAKASLDYTAKHEAKRKVRALESVRSDIRRDMGYYEL